MDALKQLFRDEEILIEKEEANIVLTVIQPIFNEMRVDKCPSFYPKTESELRDVLNKCAKYYGSSGALIKILSNPLSVIKLRNYAKGKCIVLNKNKTTSRMWSYDLGICFTNQDRVSEKYQQRLDDKIYHCIGKSFATDIEAEIGNVLSIAYNSINRYVDPKTEEERLYIYEPRVQNLFKEGTQPDFFQTALRIGKDSGLLITKEPVKALDLLYPVPPADLKNFDPEYKRGDNYDQGIIKMEEIPEGIGPGRFIWFAIEDKEIEKSLEIEKRKENGMICFYHDDLDGLCAGAIVQRKYPNCEMIRMNYGDEFPWSKIEENNVVYMVDFCLQPFQKMVDLVGKTNLIWIDHHKSALEEAEKVQFECDGIRKDGIGACELTWEFFNSKESMPEGVRLLGRYDVWDLSEEQTLPFQMGLRRFITASPSASIWNRILGDSDSKFIEDTVRIGKEIQEYQKAIDERLCDQLAFETAFENLKAIAINASGGSQLFDSVFDPKKHDLMIVFSRLPLPKKLWTVLIFSEKSEVDCAVIGKKFGGGGHKGTAGFQCKDLPFEF